MYTYYQNIHTIVKTPPHTHTHTHTSQYKLKQPQYKMHTKLNSHNTLKYSRLHFKIKSLHINHVRSLQIITLQMPLMDSRRVAPCTVVNKMHATQLLTACVHKMYSTATVFCVGEESNSCQWVLWELLYQLTGFWISMCIASAFGKILKEKIIFWLLYNVHLNGDIFL
jgi:hypothetical protein